MSCIKSLLTGRLQRVKICDALSASRPIVSGVQQGSVLGPILFLLFINDMVNSIPSAAKDKLFADDVKSYIAITGETCITNFSVLLEAIHTWSDRWQLPLSIPKCGWMLISNRIDTRSLSFNIAAYGTA